MYIILCIYILIYIYITMLGIGCIVFIIFIQTSSHEQVNFLVAPSSEGALSTVTLLKPLSATLCLGDQRSDPTEWGSQFYWIQIGGYYGGIIVINKVQNTSKYNKIQRWVKNVRKWNTNGRYSVPLNQKKTTVARAEGTSKSFCEIPMEAKNGGGCCWFLHTTTNHAFLYMYIYIYM